MVCYNCGQTCADGVRFCTNCGADLAAATNAVNTAANPAMQGMETAPAQKEKKPIDKKMAGLVAIILIVMCVIALMNSKPDYVTMEKKSILDIDVIDDNVMVSFANGKSLKLKYESCSSVQYSIDQTVACFVNEDEEVIVIKNGKEIKTGVEEVSNVVLSVYGDTFAYLEDVEADKETGVMGGDLHLFYIKNKKDKKVASDVRTNSVVLSPDGKTVAYTTDWEYEDDDDESAWTFKGYYSVNGKEPKKIDTDAKTFAIADKGKFIYYTDGDRVYVKKKNKDGVKLADNVELEHFIVNEDLSQMIYTVSDNEDDDYTTYITEKGKERVKISGGYVSGPCLPRDGVMKSISNIYGTFSGVESLEEFLYSENGKISYLSKKNEFETVVSRGSGVVLSDDMESLIYVDDDGDVYRVTNFAKGGKKKKIATDTEAISIDASGDLKYVYFLNDDEELYCIKGKKTKMVAEEVEELCAVSADGKGCYYTVEEDEDEYVLFYVKKAGKGKEVVSAEHIDVDNYDGILTVNYGKDDEYSFNLLKGKKMKEIYKWESD